MDSSNRLPRIARRMNQIAPFHVMELLTRARELEAAGRSIIHMEVGEPDFPTPQPVIEAANEFIRSGRVFYTPALGIPELREAISRFYAERYGVDVSPERIAVTAGASGALLLALAALLDPGDELLLPDPGYPCNRHFVRMLEGVPRALCVGPESGYQPTAEQVAQSWTARTRGLLVASPANPTGTLIAAPTMAGLAACVGARGGALLVDEIYHGLTYDCDAQTALSLSDEIFVINSFSKYFGMTGWRLGWLVAPLRFMRDIEKLAQNLFISPSTPAQHAALAAFRPETIALLEGRRAEFRSRRDFLLPALRRLGFRIAAAPRGAFYLYADCASIADDSEALARELIEQAGVAITPGLDFGNNAPHRHVRFAYTVTRDKLEEGVARLARHLGT
ncbi:(5-formylfuran-3-yl)methyl phosphate transaminase [Rhodocyclaceae bacterium]|jgi:aspartate/methionine/tyrosine aminotransferase|nr:(5-formylfuran-3-yl)methyl phosphate transaminase [Rhodocyclaceae bacterium]